VTKKKSRKTKRAVETEAQRVARIAREAVERVAKRAREAGIPEHRIAQGHLGETEIVDLSGELGGKRMSLVPVLINRGGSAVDRWLNRDQTGMFGEGEERAIRYTQNLWARIDGGLQAVDPAADVVDNVEGWSQQEALTEIKLLEGRIPRKYWQCYENVCRFDEEAGVAGSNLATNNRSAIDAAKTCVAYTAALIAQFRRL